MFGIECDIAFRAKFALQLIRSRLETGDPQAMYDLVLIDRGVNEQSEEGEESVSSVIRKEVAQRFQDGAAQPFICLLSTNKET